MRQPDEGAEGGKAVAVAAVVVVAEECWRVVDAAEAVSVMEAVGWG